MTSKRGYGFIALLTVIAGILFAACGRPSSEEQDNPLTEGGTAGDSGPVVTPETFSDRSYEDSVVKAVFSGSTAEVNLKGLKDNDIYLVKVNTGSDLALANSTGGASGYSGLTPPPRTNAVEIEAAADAVCGFAPAALPEIQPRYTPITGRNSFVAPKKGATRFFWVDKYAVNEGKHQATLRAVGKYGNVWVMDDVFTAAPIPPGVYTKVNTTMAEDMAATFDKIYPAATAAFGYEQGGGPKGDGGADGDPKVQILILLATTNFVSPVDLYSQEQVADYPEGYCNSAEMIYMSTTTASADSAHCGPILAHEFMHLIHASGLNIWMSASWHCEMIAELAKEIISPFFIPTGNSMVNDVLLFARAEYFKAGVKEWTGVPTNLAYLKSYAFGVYLVRNYGGIDLIRHMITNQGQYGDSADYVTDAVKVFDPGMDFSKTLSRYGEAMIFSGAHKPKGAVTFDRTITQTIGGTKYVLPSVDIWQGINRPAIFPLTPTEMWPFSFIIQSSDDWLRKTGDYSITLQRPANEAVELYLMVR